MATWLEHLVGQLLARELSERRDDDRRLIRLVDASVVARSGMPGSVWRVHAAFDLPHERFSSLAVSDDGEAERPDLILVSAGEIRVADRGYPKVSQMRAMLAAGVNVVIRAG